MPSSEEVTQRAGSLRAMSGFTQPEFTALRPSFDEAFLASRQEHTRDGHPRTRRRYSPYDTSPVPTMADQWLCILTSRTQHPIQEGHGHLLGMSQAHAKKWRHLLHTVVHQALAQQERLPARTAAECATVLASQQTKDGPPSPRVGMMVLHDQSPAPKLQRTNKTITVARRNAIRSKTSS
jgi:hypothetical protein